MGETFYQLVCCEEGRSVFRIMVEKNRRKESITKTLTVWEINIKVHTREGERVWDVVDWTNLSQDRDHWRALVKTVMNLWMPKSIDDFLSS